MKSNMQLSLLIENLENVSQNGIAQVVLQICHILSESHWIYDMHFPYFVPYNAACSLNVA